jgi:glycosyltransferase involved in cell wall biosynthesis
MPKVSIVVPVYNVEKYLEECVESLRNQTLQDIEIILVDDESPDNCPVMCDHYAEMDSRIKVVHKKNGGLGFARNSGLEVATGEYVAFTDSDDYEEPETYETLTKIAEEGECDVVYYSFSNRYMSLVGERIYEGTEQVRELMLNIIANPPEGALDRNMQVSSCLGLYRRDILEKNHIRFHSERELISEDLIFNIDGLDKARKIAVTNHKLYYYRITNNSLTQKVRIDRHKKNKLFYQYLNKRFEDMGFAEEGWLRSTRLFIGYTRTTILQICKSDLSYMEKRRWVLDICREQDWKPLIKRYPYKKLPLKYRLFLEFVVRQLFLPLWLMSKVS